MGMRSKHLNTKDQKEGEGGHKTPGAKAVVKKTWYDIMTEARTEEGKKQSNQTNEGDTHTKNMEKGGTGKQTTGEGMEFEMEGTRDEEKGTKSREIPTKGTTIDLNEPLHDTSMIIYKNQIAQPLPNRPTLPMSYEAY